MCFPNKQTNLTDLHLHYIITNDKPKNKGVSWSFSYFYIHSKLLLGT